MTSTGGGGYHVQARGAAEGADAGPSMGAGKGPTTRRDVVIAILAIAVVVGVIVVLAV